MSRVLAGMTQDFICKFGQRLGNRVAALLRKVSQSHVVMQTRVVGIERDGALELRDGLVHVFRFPIGGAEHNVHLRGLAMPL